MKVQKTFKLRCRSLSKIKNSQNTWHIIIFMFNAYIVVPCYSCLKYCRMHAMLQRDSDCKLKLKCVKNLKGHMTFQKKSFQLLVLCINYFPC